MSEAIDFLTGAPSASWTNTDQNTIKGVGLNAWNIINSNDAAQNIMTAATGNDGCNGDKTYNSYHIPCGHAYSLIGTYAIKDAKGNVTNRLMLIRNPWGVDAGYTGNWNDGDTTRWTPANKAQAPYTNNPSDGLFFIEDIDFVKAFGQFTISYYREKFQNNILEVLSDTATNQR